MDLPSQYSITDRATRALFLCDAIKDGLYELPLTASSLRAQANFTSTASLSLWHARFGHPSIRVTQLLLRSLSLPSSSMAADSFTCVACAQAKAHALPYPASPTRSTTAFGLLFLDV